MLTPREPGGALPTRQHLLTRSTLEPLAVVRHLGGSLEEN
ncbi:hypothetical protein P3T27_007431 [Kitasatospora sp. MAA19]|nr:hypothetical protein [Kitasatospora sp. MAA19]